MALQIDRPLFSEGQILGADDLEASLAYNRDQNARHARLSHTWGIADGLALSLTDGALQLAPGMAVDSSGAAVIVPEPVTLEATDFINQCGNKPSNVYPLYLRSRQQDAPSALLVGRCGTGASTRRRESYVLEFRDLTSLLDWDKQRAWPVTGGPDDLQPDRRVLLGFVNWNRENKQFTDFTLEHLLDDGTSFRPRYVGVRADSVETRSGTLTVRTRNAGTTDAPMLLVDAADPEQIFALGADNGQGELREPPLVVVDAKGNLTVQGAIKGKAASGDVLVQSGLATHGIKLPLPPGVRDDDIRDERFTLHLMLTPRPDLSDKPDTVKPWVAVAEECAVDQHRRVRCLLRWLNADSITDTTVQLPGVCQYLILAGAPPTEGAVS